MTGEIKKTGAGDAPKKPHGPIPADTADLKPGEAEKLYGAPAGETPTREVAGEKPARDTQRILARAPEDLRPKKISDAEILEIKKQFEELKKQDARTLLASFQKRPDLNLSLVVRRYTDDVNLQRVLRQSEYLALTLLGYRFLRRDEFMAMLRDAEKGKPVNFQKIFLSGGTFTGLDLSSLDFSLSTFHNVTFSDSCRFDFASFNGCEFLNCTVQKKSLKATNFSQAYIDSTSIFANSNFSSIPLTELSKGNPSGTANALDTLASKINPASILVKSLRLPIRGLALQQLIERFETLGVDDEKITIKAHKVKFNTSGEMNMAYQSDPDHSSEASSMELDIETMTLKDFKAMVKRLAGMEAIINIDQVSFDIDGLELNSDEQSLELSDFRIQVKNRNIADIVKRLAFYLDESLSKNPLEKVCDQSVIETSFANAKVFGKFFGADLNSARMNGADLNSADFTEASLQGARLEGAHLDHTNFTQANCQNARFNAAQGLSPIFVEANTSNASFDATRFDSPKFEKANLTQTTFAGAMMKNPSFEEASLLRANFDGSVLSEPVFYRVKSFQGTSFKKGCGLINAKWPGGAKKMMSFTGLQIGENYDASTIEASSVQEFKAKRERRKK